MSTLITLTTDFGNLDAYIGILKGVILKINPAARIVDISHQIEPQNILQAASLISTAIPYFPENAIHLIVVDPGVGSSRKALILKSEKGIFVAPDNGVLSYVMPEKVEAVEITNHRFMLRPVSTTFHARDIFAPAAAHLSLGVPMDEFGEKVISPVRLQELEPQTDGQGNITGQVIHIDRFGNLITNITKNDLPEGDFQIEIRGRIIEGLSASYAEGPEILAIIESNDRLEIAAQNNSASKTLGAKISDRVEIRPKNNG